MNLNPALQKSRGFSLVELLVALAILGGLALGVGFAVDYFQKQSAIANSENQLSLEAQTINAKLRKQFQGGSSLQMAPGYGSPSAVNQNYCYQITGSKPVSFSSTNIRNGAVFEYRVTARAASTSPAQTQQNAEPKLASTASLGLSPTATLATISRTLSMWVKLTNVAGNDRVLFTYSPDSANTSSYKMVVRVMGGNTVRVDMGMGLTEFVYDAASIRNGAWHHLVVQAGNLSAVASSPEVYVDGTKLVANAASLSTTAPTNFVSNLNYKINIGDSATATWSLGPVGLWNRSLSSAEIAKLGRMDTPNVDNAFWLPSPTANLSTSATNVTNDTTINARPDNGYLLFKKDSVNSGQVHYKMYKADQAITCPDPASADDPTLQGFELLSASTCTAPAATPPLLPGGGDLGFKWNCNLSDGTREAAATVVTGGAATGAVIKSADACQIPISPEEFKTTENTNTAFLIMDSFDPGIDLLAFEGTEFPAVMPTVDSLNITRPASLPSSVTTINWYADVDNNVGMYKIVANASQTKEWWVNNVFKKIKYKTRSDVYTSERSLVFALGDAWPIKVCPGFGYKAKYHFYSVKANTLPVGATASFIKTRYKQYFEDTNKRYHGMHGYLANMRCPTEKDQISRRVLTSGVTATLGMWTVFQESNSTTSSPNFATGREGWDSATNQKTSLAWSDTIFFLYPDSDILSSTNRSSNPGSTAGKTTWRIIGGAKTDNNAIVLTDHTLCDGTTRRGHVDPGASFAGCQGISTLTLPDTCTTPGTPACLLQNQVGGNRQYNWWKPREAPPPSSCGSCGWYNFTGTTYQWNAYGPTNGQCIRGGVNRPSECTAAGAPGWSSLAGEPNKSGAYIWMGYNPLANVDTDFWDDMLRTTQLTNDLVEYGDHPHDAGLAVDSAYRAALRRDSNAAITSTIIANEDHDPPNTVSKTIKSVNSFYCK